MNASMTLAELAVTHPAAARIFYQNGLDFCCGGKRPVGEACRELGLDPEAILSDISQAESAAVEEQRWDTKTIRELINFIVDHYHARLRTEIPELVAMAEKVERVHAEKTTCPRGLREHLEAVRVSVNDHLDKEEGILFPLILSGRGHHASGPIRVMEFEHREHAVNLQRTRELTRNLTAPPEACATWQALYTRLGALESELMQHIHLENNVLFQRVLSE
jgi:regulator of cell morphogenesis and NO signaling